MRNGLEMMPNGWRSLLIQHEQSAPGGYVSDWLGSRGSEQDVLRIDTDGRGVDPRRYDLIVSLGSALAAYDDSVPWLEGERLLLLEAARAEVPILGICFGSQLLARVLGGQARRSERPEIGWFSVRTREPSLVSAGPWFQWHFDQFTPPPGARVLAETAGGPQAFVLGRSLGVQFHPEVTPAIVDTWAQESVADLDREGVDRELLRADTRRRENESRAAAWRLFDAFLERVAGITERRTR
jgi:GMP synthase-like glutamine amidotransferase